MPGNRIELWGRLRAAPEVRVTPRGTTVLRIAVDCTPGADDELALAVVMTGPEAGRVGSELSSGDEVRVEGSLRGVKRRLKSGLCETLLEVLASTIKRGK